MSPAVAPTSAAIRNNRPNRTRPTSFRPAISTGGRSSYSLFMGECAQDNRESRGRLPIAQPEEIAPSNKSRISEMRDHLAQYGAGWNRLAVVTLQHFDGLF